MTLSIISRTRALIIFESVFKLISFGGLPRSPGMLTISFSLFSPGHAEPNFTFRVSACFSIISQPSLISSVMTFPPNGMTAVCRMMLSLKMAMSVVPPPMSTSTTPASFSSSANTAADEARGSKVISPTLSSLCSTQRAMFLIEAICPTTIWKFASKREPYIPCGLMMLLSPSTRYS